MSTQDLQKLLHNLDEDQVAVLGSIALRMASAKADKWTGKTTFAINMDNGVICDMHVNQTEVIRLQRKNKEKP